jgi:hypothetical protein
MKSLIYIALLTVLAGTMTAQAQSKDPVENKRIVEAKNYVFVAQTASPQRGRLVNLTTEYDLTIAGDSIIAFLPYFGRAFTAPLPGAEGGIKFTSTHSAYSVTSKKGKWEIVIRPKDVSDVQELYLDIFDNGSANLRIASVNRSAISYNGYIREGKVKEKRAF